MPAFAPDFTPGYLLPASCCLLPAACCSSAPCHTSRIPHPRATCAGGIDERAVKELLRDYCDDAVKAYVEDKLKKRYQVRPGVGE